MVPMLLGNTMLLGAYTNVHQPACLFMLWFYHYNVLNGPVSNSSIYVSGVSKFSSLNRLASLYLVHWSGVWKCSKRSKCLP